MTSTKRMEYLPSKPAGPGGPEPPAGPGLPFIPGRPERPGVPFSPSLPGKPMTPNSPLGPGYQNEGKANINFTILNKCFSVKPSTWND